VILATLRLIIRPERRHDFLAAIRGMLEPARVERGCLSCHFYKDVENRSAFVLMEEWETQQDLERHLRTDNQRRLLVLMDLLRTKPEFRFETVSDTAGLDLIENVLKEDDENR